VFCNRNIGGDMNGHMRSSPGCVRLYQMMSEKIYNHLKRLHDPLLTEVCFAVTPYEGVVGMKDQENPGCFSHVNYEGAQHEAMPAEMMLRLISWLPEMRLDFRRCYHGMDKGNGLLVIAFSGFFVPMQHKMLFGRFGSCDEQANVMKSMRMQVVLRCRAGEYSAEIDRGMLRWMDMAYP
jgi:hypothetical protein